ncbi:hypothetical protein CANMA_001040 [Candida margitis]|uniref:uncharacterized protein n=1 Tax=Candida margitis TaxID=1775924 RepID=UPI002227706C|nr:uncharacterized protein CANMA_001040 [Candida margitis]KAI5969898.1 hypothetical protein CANMA_001040 [Candida margitis]
MSANLNPTKSNNLTVPKSQHSYSTSLSSNISPQYFFANNNISKTSSRSGAASTYRLSRSNTNNTSDAYLTNHDNQSIQSIDKIPSAKPSVTYSDKLWTQIDVLDDVKRMAKESKVKDTLFNEKYIQKLAKLKESQDQLLQTMSALQTEDMNTNEAQKQELYQLKTAEIANKTEAVGEDATKSLKSKNSTHESSVPETEQSNAGEVSPSSDSVLELTAEEQEKVDKFFAINDEAYDSEDEADFQSQTIYNKDVFDEINRYVQQVKQDLRGLGDAMKECSSNRDTT